MGDYEKEQQRLLQLFEECLSDEAEPFADNGSSDEFVPSNGEDSDCSSSEDEPVVKKQKLQQSTRYELSDDENVPSTSKNILKKYIFIY